MVTTIHKNGFFKQDMLLLVPFVKEPWREFTLAEIKRLTKKTSHHYVFEALKKFCRHGVLLERKMGNTNLYLINHRGQDTQYLTLVESMLKEKRKDIPYHNVHQVMTRIKDPFFTLLIGGSYAQGKQKKQSDLDVCIIIPQGQDKKPYEIALREGRLMMPEVHGFTFTAEEFRKMLENDEFNLGKELARKHILIYGGEQYYALLFEAMRHGFKG
jgi:hypothetical protein